MFSIARHFYQLLILRRTPQDFPASGFLLGLTILSYLAMGFVNNYVAGGEFRYAVLRSSLATVLVLAGTYAVLKLSRHPRRWMQTSIALLGGEAMIGFMALPFLFVISTGNSNIFLETSFLLFLIWQIAFIGHVWRHALDTNMLFGIVAALGLVIFYSWIKVTLLPFPGGTS